MNYKIIFSFLYTDDDVFVLDLQKDKISLVKQVKKQNGKLTGILFFLRNKMIFLLKVNIVCFEKFS